MLSHILLYSGLRARPLRRRYSEATSRFYTINVLLVAHMNFYRTTRAVYLRVVNIPRPECPSATPMHGGRIKHGDRMCSEWRRSSASSIRSACIIEILVSDSYLALITARMMGSRVSEYLSDSLFV